MINSEQKLSNFEESKKKPNLQYSNAETYKLGTNDISKIKHRSIQIIFVISSIDDIRDEEQLENKEVP